MGRLFAALAALAASLLRDDAKATSWAAETDAYASSSQVVTGDAAVRAGWLRRREPEAWRGLCPRCVWHDFVRTCERELPR